MTIALNHTIVPAHDKVASAQFYARIFGFAYDGPLGHFEPVTIAAQALTLDFDNAENFASHHYAFKVSEGRVRRNFRPGQGRGSRLRQRTGQGHGW